MTTDYNLQFIRGKLNGISKAIMYNMSSSAAKLPNDVVRFVEIDDHGRVWFSIQSPRFEKNVIESTIPVRLFFYEKGLNYYIEASGIACVEEEGKTELSDHSYILFKMMPSCFQFEEFSQHNWLDWLHRRYMGLAEKIRLFYQKKVKQYEYQA